ncbi:MAG: transcription termination/antitermination NusG family protein [Bryobacteraceae bacterium]|jgi:transcription antitermination factor NusG
MLPSSAIAACPRNLPWYALKVRTRSEPVVVTVLRNRGYDPFAPTIAERRRYCDRMTVVQTPVFPGYVFCRLDAHRKAPVLSAPAVEYIVSFAGTPVIVPEEEIEAVRRALDAGARPRPYLAVGQRIRIEYGALAGLEGILQRTGNEHRLVVSVHLLQRSVSVEIDEDRVQVIEPTPRKPVCPSPTCNVSR